MDSVLPFLAFIWGLVAGTLLFSTVGRWIHTIAATVQTFRASDRRGTPVWSLLASTLLHSGPWTLAIAAFLTYYLLSRPHASWWFWFFAGVLTSPVVIVAAWLRSTRRKGAVESTPLTPDRLALRRKRFVWGNTLFVGGAMSVIMIGGMSGAVRMPGLIVFIVAVCMAGGYVVALIMWQWKKSILEGEEYERRRAESGK